MMGFVDFVQTDERPWVSVVVSNAVVDGAFELRHDNEVGMKRNWTRGCFASQCLSSCFLCIASLSAMQ